ncbi:asparaginase/glutaminase active site 1 [Lucifera butyrica]|uniref:asparaginase n=1 Tax=Lucifera butyrica TaxID=1351585 RepID=A0A498RE65_9FIRM|nr:type II asparaginase [Lucifera butyrica]VBB09110.1 asparaginase/glutaminase active site 1 [Lucifera butyrica]
MKNIVILATGGTIAAVSQSVAATTAYQSGIVPIAELLNEIRPLTNLANITSEQVAQIDSADMSHELWLFLANRINSLLQQPDVDGIVLTHGTDTMEETAYFLNLVVNSDKPVVLVGAMRPSTAISSDGPMNLYNAIVLAASDAASGKGVLVALNDTVNSSRDVTKTNTALQDTFKAPELGYLGYLIDGQPHFYRLPARKHTYLSEFRIDELAILPKVHIIYGYVDDGGALVRAAVKDGAQGIVYAGLGNGNMSQHMQKVFNEIRQQGVVVVRSTRVGNGVVTKNGAVDDDEYGFVAADTLSPQKARILLMLALTKTRQPDEIQKIFETY